MINAIKKIFLIKYVNKLSFPKFNELELDRYYIKFTGKVQRVGFRDQLRLLAEKLDISGYVRNISNNTVITEIQGPKEKLIFLVNAIVNEKRFILDEVEISEIGLIDNDSKFNIIKI